MEERDRVIITKGKTDHIYNIIIYPLSIAQAGVHPQILGGKKNLLKPEYTKNLTELRIIPPSPQC